MNSKFKPYYAVIFTSIQKKNIEGYAEMANKMEELAKKQSGYLGIDSSKSDIGITVSYWENLEAIKNWKRQTEHLEAQRQGRTKWYSWYKVRICKVEREYEFSSIDN
ncbi:heme-degrading monooxygenase HmoA [Flavobacteriaceae bacterium MAR_2010_105]|nr:heme-degrading monooxygenase HmoA [Flavobacteriaceae bacterium MAR_2010_105]